LRQRPAEGGYHANLALVLKALGRREEAETAFRRALALKPGQADALNNLANLLSDDGRDAEAETCYREALRSRPDLGVARGGYGALAAASGHRVVLEVQRPLVPLLAGLPGVERVVAHGDQLPPFDLHCPLLSLPGILGTTAETIPAEVPYRYPVAEALASCEFVELAISALFADLDEDFEDGDEFAGLDGLSLEECMDLVRRDFARCFRGKARATGTAVPAEPSGGDEPPGQTRPWDGGDTASPYSISTPSRPAALRSWLRCRASAGQPGDSPDDALARSPPARGREPP